MKEMATMTMMMEMAMMTEMMIGTVMLTEWTRRRTQKKRKDWRQIRRTSAFGRTDGLLSFTMYKCIDNLT